LRVASPNALDTRAPRPREEVVVFSISGQVFAISATSVQEIRSADNLGGAVFDLEQSVIEKVRHMVEREGRAYYVLSGCIHFELRASRPAIVLILRDLPVAVLVNRIEEMAEMNVLFSLPPSFQGLERRWYRGLTVLADKVLPVLDPRGLLTREELDLLKPAAEECTQRMHAASEAGMAR
jgi:chemotaxis signal transduction protein